MIDERKLFNQPVQNSIRIYDNIQNITTDQGNDYITASLLDYSFWENTMK